MDIIQRNLFRLLRSGTFGAQEQIEPMSAFKWERLYQIAMLHDVIPYAYQGITNCRSQFFMRLTDKQELTWKRANDEIAAHQTEEEEDTFETGNDFNSRAYAQRSYASYHDRTDQGAVYAAGHTMSFAAKYAQRARDMEKASAKAQFAQPKANGFSVQDTAPSDQIFKVGDAVKHRIFGLGTVTEVKWVNTDYQVRVNFAKVGEKLLFAKLARLEKV